MNDEDRKSVMAERSKGVSAEIDAEAIVMIAFVRNEASGAYEVAVNAYSRPAAQLTQAQIGDAVVMAGLRMMKQNVDN